MCLLATASKSMAEMVLSWATLPMVSTVNARGAGAKPTLVEWLKGLHTECGEEVASGLHDRHRSRHRLRDIQSCSHPSTFQATTCSG